MPDAALRIPELEQHTVAPERESFSVLKKFDVVEITGYVVGRVVKDKVLAPVSGLVNGVAPPNGPYLVFVPPGDVGDTVAASFDVGLHEVGDLCLATDLAGANEELTSVEGCPDTFFNFLLDETHVLDTTGSAAIVRDPEVVSGAPS